MVISNHSLWSDSVSVVQSYPRPVSVVRSAVPSHQFCPGPDQRRKTWKKAKSVPHNRSWWWSGRLYQQFWIRITVEHYSLNTLASFLITYCSLRHHQFGTFLRCLTVSTFLKRFQIYKLKAADGKYNCICQNTWTIKLQRILLSAIQSDPKHSNVSTN